MQSGKRTTYLVPQYQYLQFVVLCACQNLIKAMARVEVDDQENTITTPERQALVRS